MLDEEFKRLILKIINEFKEDNKGMEELRKKSYKRSNQ
jgi:hypothetical protein